MKLTLSYKNSSCHTLLMSHTIPEELGEQIAPNDLQWQLGNIRLDA